MPLNKNISVSLQIWEGPADEVRECHRKGDKLFSSITIVYLLFYRFGEQSLIYIYIIIYICHGHGNTTKHSEFV